MKRHCALNQQKIIKGIVKFYYLVRTFISGSVVLVLYYDNIGSVCIYVFTCRSPDLAGRSSALCNSNIVF